MQAQPTDLTITIEADSYNTEDPPRIINTIGNALLAKVAENNRLAEGQDRVNLDREEPGPVYQGQAQHAHQHTGGGDPRPGAGDVAGLHPRIHGRHDQNLG